MKTRTVILILILFSVCLLTALFWVLSRDAKQYLDTYQATMASSIKKTSPCGVDGCEKVPPKPKGIDLDVTYISRTPMYNRYQVEYTKDGEPFLAEGTENNQRWPKQGELVTFTAHIINKGTVDSGAFTFQWLIDDQMMMEDEHPSLPAGFETKVSFEWEWSHPLDGERLLESHTVGLWVDPDNHISETYEKNNQLVDRTDASSLSFLITPEAYRLLEKPISGKWSYSAEDWLQRQITAMNSALEASVYDSAPHGILERVRLDQIIITDSNQAVDLNEDGQFFITEDIRLDQGYYDPESDVSGWFLHEISHLLGMIDIYKLDVPLETVQVRDRLDQPLQMEFKASLLNGGIMSNPGIDPKQFDEHTALAMNLNKGYRRGYFGEYLYDVPKKTSLVVLDTEDNPAKNVQIRLYQRIFTPKINGSTAGTIDDQPEFEGVTGTDGSLILTNRPISAPLTTATGHSLIDNPFSLINVTGSNGMFLVELLKGTHQEFHWLDITDLNLAAWKGSSTIQLLTHIPVENAPVIPITLTGILQRGEVELEWSAEGDEDLLRFSVYRAKSPDYEFERILTQVSKTYYDEKLDNKSRSAIYAITVVSENGLESGFSNLFYALPLAAPSAVEVDADNNRVILDPKNGYALLSQLPNGTYQKILGSYQNHLDYSKYMVLGQDGLLYITHPGDPYSDRHSVQIFDQTHTLLREFSSTGSDEGQLMGPAGIAIWGEPCIADSCRILVSDSGNNRIQVFDENGVFLSTFGKKGWLKGQFSNPQGISVDSKGQVIVVDSGNNRIQVFTFDGKEFTHVKTIRRGFKNPTGVAVYGSEYIVVADTGHNEIKLLNGKGQLINEFTVPKDNYFGKFSEPTGVAIDLEGTILVADTGNQRVVSIPGAIPTQ